MAYGQIKNRIGTDGEVMSMTSGINNTTSQNLTTTQLNNGDVVSFTESGGNDASSIVHVAKGDQAYRSIWACGDALQRTKNRLAFLGNNCI